MSRPRLRKPESRFAIDGSRQTGETVREQNVMACMAIANVVKSSFGPVGLDKMLVDDIGDVIVTNDGATILKQLEVEHPAARVLVDLADLQDKEVGDGTTSVVILAAELLKVLCCVPPPARVIITLAPASCLTGASSNIRVGVKTACERSC